MGGGANLNYYRAGADPGERGSWGSGPPNFIKSGKTLRACVRIRHILVVNSYLDTPLPPFRNSCIRPGRGGQGKGAKPHALDPYKYHNILVNYTPQKVNHTFVLFFLFL